MLFPEIFESVNEASAAAPKDSALKEAQAADEFTRNRMAGYWKSKEAAAAHLQEAPMLAYKCDAMLQS